MTSVLLWQRYRVTLYEATRMKVDTLPETIATILLQIGGFGIHGAFAYIGAEPIRYRCPRLQGECRPDEPSRLVTQGSVPSVEYGVGIEARVNGRRGRAWTLIIAYEPDDTYTVWLVEGHDRRTADTMILACHRDVYCDQLKEVVEQSYDRAIHDHNGGFIHLD